MVDVRHLPVLHIAGSLDSPVLRVLRPKHGETVCDATLGLGGHAKDFLRAIGPKGKLFGIDADAVNLEVAHQNLSAFASQVALHHANFRDVTLLNLPPLDILFADLGLSSPHLDDPSRGFAHRASGPLDLRYDRTKGWSAAELLKQSSEADTTSIFRDFGELRYAGKLASIIRKRADAGAMQTTADLKAAAEEAFQWRAPKLFGQVFQALRIAVNDELGALEALLEDGTRLLAPGGRMGVIAYHSLEDRMVKQKFRELTTPEKDPHTGAVARPASFSLLMKKPLKPSDEEIAANPRARSAVFRAIQRNM